MLADTNILVYAINKNSPKHKQAKEFLEDNVADFSKITEIKVINPFS